MRAKPSRPDAADLAERAADYASGGIRWQAVAVGILVIAAAFYPAALSVLAGVLGARALAILLVVAGLATSFARRTRQLAGGSRIARLLVVVLGLAAATTGSELPLLLVPSCIYAELSRIFIASLDHEPSFIERAARLMQPAVPGLIAPYCRRVTAMWAGIFALIAASLTVAALTCSAETWRSMAGYGTWGVMSAVTLGEFLVRKTYFRYYWSGGPFDRLWSRLFPSEATSMGRRCEAYIRAMREELAKLDS